jgi:citrate lyase subunit beta/citryl-CoA lyase
MPALSAGPKDADMMLRSRLFVPGDRPDRMEKALNSGADALILDLEDAVASSAKPAARTAVAAFLSRAHRMMPLFVRINPLDSGLAEDDLTAGLDARPDGVVLPKSEGRTTVAELDAMLFGHEGVQILPIATETPAAIFGLGDYRGASNRLPA